MSIIETLGANWEEKSFFSLPSLSQRETLFSWWEDQPTETLTKMADEVCRKTYGNKVYLRGLIEFSNECFCDCLYCGIRRSNAKITRYSLTDEEIIETVKRGLQRGFHTFVLQSGENRADLPERMTKLLFTLRKIAKEDVAFTLSCGVYPREVYREWKKAGAHRYLLRFETSDPRLYASLCPGKTLDRRLQALEDLRQEGYAVGSGFMVGLPGEDARTRFENVLLCRDLRLEMVGIGPFIPHPDTPLGKEGHKSLPIEFTVRTTALLRLFLPWANIPATTAAGSLHPRGREMMLEAGANVLMPNITPVEKKKHYLLYANKICLDEDGWECLSCLSLRVASVGKTISFERGESVLREKAQ
ncbi:[FeFe] hydrogenase H-cluster radical SAM maturase HydE [Thermospira aquatica]|uniref:[FeFe] hydrogenase H-cluster radical SAM maturase HydE n=1 Tax=Thermospira aquatica TaxID=2828656 RepID=A0AAX3BBC8_9SPIR|nr:[FeFe] hydrogenase H-cluster radical SAM maturase HydE [Thermospira aquatica]URA09550.1 [FeFe] hydrogenase H-cluster radical SAM maturase HydE [Thermospira aquatica]